MSRRLNWERVNRKKATQSLSDEQEFMERDPAARWLERQQSIIERKQPRLKKDAAETRVARSIDRMRQQLSGPLPWEGESEFDEG